MASATTATDRLAPPRASHRLHSLLVRYPVIAGAFAVCTGLAVIVGWAAGIRAITQPFAHLEMMIASTAVMTVLAGLSLVCWTRAAQTPWARVAGRGLALVVVLMALSALALYVVYLSEGRVVGVTRHPHLVRSPFTAGAFALLGLALVAVDRRVRGACVSDYLALVVFAMATAALLGYLFGAPPLYGHPGAVFYIAMSPVTAVMLFVLAFGVLALHAEDGVLSIVLAADAGGVAARHMLLGLAVFPPVALIVVIGTRVGWYALPVGSALVLLLVLGESSAFLIRTAKRLSRIDRTQRRYAEELRASEQRVRALVEQAKDAIFVADLDGRYTEVNPAASELLGYSREELLGMRISDLLAAEDVDKLAAERATVMAGKASRREWRLRRKDGSFVPVEVVAHVLPDLRWQAIVRDISEREHAERLLAQAFTAERQAREDLEAVFHARDLLAEVVASLGEANIVPVLAQIAEQARVLTGAEHAAVGIGIERTKAFEHWVTAGASDALTQAVGPHPRPLDMLGLSRLEPPIHSVLATPITRRGTVVGMVYVVNKHGGAPFTERDERLVTLLADGVALAIETTRGIAAEAARRRWLQSVIDQIPEGVAVLDAQGQIFLINRAGQRQAFARDERRDLAGLAQFVARDALGNDVPVDKFPVVRALRTGNVIPDEEYQLQLPDGRWLPVEACAAPIRDPDEGVAGAVVVWRDVSERKELERLREEWIAVVAHDLRQPIHTIVFSLELLKDLGEGALPHVERVQKAAYELNRMIDDLLDAARITANRLTVDCTPADVCHVVGEAIARVQAADPSVEIELDAPPELIAWLDADRIQQVLGNLLSNALKYRTPGTPIHVEVRGDESGCEVGVTNAGPPIEPDEQDRIFARFVRTRSGKHKRGIGLGLYISKGLIEAHGGQMTVSSAEGRTRFSFTLPAMPPVLGQAPPSPPRPPVVA